MGNKSYNKCVRLRDEQLARIGHAYAQLDSPVRQSQTTSEMIEQFISSPNIRASFIRQKAAYWFPDLDVRKDAHLIWKQSLVTARSIDLEIRRRPLVPYREEPRSHGKPPRLVVNLPPELRLIHNMAKDCVYAQHRAGPHIYHWPGRGTHSLIHDLMKEVRSGKTWLLTADIAQCYSSVNFNAVYSLEILPPKLLASAMDPSNLDFRIYQKQQSTHERKNKSRGRQFEWSLYECMNNEPRTPKGFMEGSSLSGALLAMLFEDLPSHLSEDIRVFIFGDNIFVPLREESACREVADILRQYFADHPAGPFSLTIENFDLSSEAAPSLGYEINADPLLPYDVAIAQKNLRKVFARIEVFAADFAHYAESQQFEASEAVLRKAVGNFPQIDLWYRDTIIREAVFQELALEKLRLVKPTICAESQIDEGQGPW